MVMDNLIPGTYVSKRSDGYVEFLVQCGMSEAKAKELANSTWTYTIRALGNGVYELDTTSKELPQYNQRVTMRVGEAQHIDDMLMGVKAKTVYEFDGDNKFKVSADGGFMVGKYGWTEEFTSEGVIIDMSDKDGSYKEIMHRQ